MFEGEVKESLTDMEQRDVEMNLQEEVKLAFSVVGWRGDRGQCMAFHWRHPVHFFAYSKFLYSLNQGLSFFFCNVPDSK